MLSCCRARRGRERKTGSDREDTGYTLRIIKLLSSYCSVPEISVLQGQVYFHFPDEVDHLTELVTFFAADP